MQYVGEGNKRIKHINILNKKDIFQSKTSDGIRTETEVSIFVSVYTEERRSSPTTKVCSPSKFLIFTR